MSGPRALPFPRDPSYGRHVLRRRIRLANHGDRVEAHLSDTFHEMHCTLHHAGGNITAIDARTLRIPATSCPGAAVVLRELTGLPLATPPASLYDPARFRRNCTHMFDLAVLAIAQANRPDEPERVYDSAVPDEIGTPVAATVDRDGERIHRWWILDHHIVEPSELAGRPVLGGFTRWALAAFTGDVLEAALVLHRTCLIAVGMPYLTEAFAGQSLRKNPGMRGLCHSYAEETLRESMFLEGARLDFTHGVTEQLGDEYDSGRGATLD